MVAEDRKAANPHKKKEKISAVFERPLTATRYHPPHAVRFSRETQMRLARAFAMIVARADHGGLTVAKLGRRRTLRRK